jgi:hypothetical protein
MEMAICGTLLGNKLGVKYGEIVKNASIWLCFLVEIYGKKGKYQRTGV